MTRATKMLWGMWLVAVPVLGGCGDSAGPVAGEGTGRDLEVFVPSLQGMPALLETQKSTLELQPAALPPGFAEIGGGSGSTQGYISSTHLTAGFNGRDLWYDYGMVGWGTAWSMKPSFTLMAGGGAITAIQGNVLSQNLYVPMAFSPSDRKVFRTSADCGLSANVDVSFSVSLGVKLSPIDASLNTTIPRATSTSQPGCAPTPTGGGGDDGSATSRGVKICYWEVWVDLNGYVVDVIFRGCYSTGGYAI